MKFRCERDVLADALSTVGRAAGGRGTVLPVLSGVRLQVTGNRLDLGGSDLDLSIQTEISTGGDGDGAEVVPARLLTEIVRALEPGAVTLEAHEDEFQITAGRSQFSVRTLPLAEFPRMPALGGSAVSFPGLDFAEGLRQVVRAASNEDSRPVLTGVLMASEGEGMRLVATDSYRLAVRDLPGTAALGQREQVLVPSRALGELQRLLGAGPDVTLRLGEQEVSFQVGPTRLTTRLIEGQYPNYRQLIPSRYPNRLIVPKIAFVDALRRVRLLVRDLNTPVRIALGAEGIELTVVSQEIGRATEDVDAKYEGAEMTVAFNPAYLMDGIEAVVGEEIVLETLDTLKPATIRSAEPADFLYLLMPVRVS